MLVPAIPKDDCQLALHCRESVPWLVCILWERLDGLSKAYATLAARTLCGAVSTSHSEGLREPADGNVFLQAFYRQLNRPGRYLYMQTHTHTHNQLNVVTQG